MGKPCSCMCGKVGGAGKAQSHEADWRARAKGAASEGYFDPKEFSDFNAKPSWMRGDVVNVQSKEVNTLLNNKVTFGDEAAKLGTIQDECFKSFDSPVQVKSATMMGGAKGGCCPCLLGARRKQSIGLSLQARTKVRELFAKMDVDINMQVTRSEAESYFKGSFGRLSVNAMFNEVDVDKNRQISEEEFVQFWEQVKKCGYSEEDILEEVDQLILGGTWVDWKDQRVVTNV